ncbi:LLM class flavin-dependent oxidoreductase [Jatrophihabitans cynanchi]|uniref:LLM class flavin-dependent oxidoreductase n=1 Tax=Jatrophihabitans cynanchi TaxID=2944128 RepID=A0ABY7K1G1_9ACTN|nr:LLM class flavin-dependent oxidoreductase [Jatrophihabitans sp. SB3-54]WAX58353.1 LLM class flavin-dependent oxidoreductase [Jatrophihabitans sp. SB3-54]
MSDVTRPRGRPRFGLAYHLQNPSRWRRAPEDLYHESIEHAAWAETIGFDSIWVSEHHFEPDGYVSSPLIFLAGVATCTSRIRLASNVIVAPLHHPLRLAEDAAALSIQSKGRFDLGVAVGYRDEEFRAFGQPFHRRGQLTESHIARLRGAWAGQQVSVDDAFPDGPAVTVTPIPTKPPRILLGGKAPRAIERAARIADAYLPPARPGRARQFFDEYLDAIERVGRDRTAAQMMCTVPAVISADPERTLATVGEHLLYYVNNYIKLGAFAEPAPFTQPSDLITAGYLELWDPDTAVRELTALLGGYPAISDVRWWAQFPGEPFEQAYERAEFFANHIRPRVDAAFEHLRVDRIEDDRRAGEPGCGTARSSGRQP